MAKKNQRIDNALVAELALPAAAANAQTESLDLQSANDNCELELSVEATSALVASKAITLKIQESDDGASFADAPWAPVVSVVGATGNGNEARAQRIGVPSTAKRYMRAYAAVEASGGSVASSKFALKACF